MRKEMKEGYQVSLSYKGPQSHQNNTDNLYSKSPTLWLKVKALMGFYF